MLWDTFSDVGGCFYLAVRPHNGNYSHSRTYSWASNGHNYAREMRRCKRIMFAHMIMICCLNPYSCIRLLGPRHHNPNNHLNNLIRSMIVNYHLVKPPVIWFSGLYHLQYHLNDHLGLSESGVPQFPSFNFPWIFPYFPTENHHLL